MDVEFSDRTDDVDWVALKAALVAGGFDNLRTPEQYRISHENSHAVLFGRLAGEFVANGRILSDGVCNAYLVDIWTAPAFSRPGHSGEQVPPLVANGPRQHVGLFTDDMQPFYASLGFRIRPDFMDQVIGRWLDPTSTS